jgi:hypothetical protein
MDIMDAMDDAMGFNRRGRSSGGEGKGLGGRTTVLACCGRLAF